jgi:hypothetical protein
MILRLVAGVNTTQASFSFRYKLVLQSFIVESVYTILYPYWSTYSAHNVVVKIN